MVTVNISEAPAALQADSQPSLWSKNLLSSSSWCLEARLGSQQVQKVPRAQPAGQVVLRSVLLLQVHGPAG